MSHRRKLKEAWDKAYDESQLLLLFRTGFKNWLKVSIIMVGILLVFCLILWMAFHNSALLIIQIGIGIAGFYILVSGHEFLHALFAHLFHCKYEFDTSVLFHYPVINKAHEYLVVSVTWPDGFNKYKKYVVGIAPNAIIIFVAVSLILLGSFFFWIGVFTIIGSSIAIVLDIKAVS